MTEARRNLMVGAFVFVGIIALGVLIVMFGAGPTWLMQRSTYPLHIRFEEVTGIRPGNLVTARGIDIGRVIDVQMLDPADFGAGVDVVVAIENRFRIPLGSRAQTTEPVLGQGRPPVVIMPGDSAAGYLEPGATMSGTVRTAIDSIFPPGIVTTFRNTAQQIGDAAEALTPVLEELHELVQSRDPRTVDQPGGLQGNLSTVVARFDSSLRHMNEVLGDGVVKSQIRETVDNLHSMSERGTRVMEDAELASADLRAMISDGRQLVTRADGVLGNMDGHMADLAGRTMNTLDKMDTVLDNLNVIGQQIASGEGTVGQLVMDAKLYESLVISTERLSLAISDLRALIAEWRQGKIRVGL
jgi:ABC-type transporter Mla subunit MlaD